DEQALEKAIAEKSIRAGLDVFAQEPATATGAFEDGIAKLPQVYGTHHIGASTDQAQEAIADETVRILNTYRTSGQVLNAVNLCHHSPATHLLTVRHRDRVGVLAHVLDSLREAGINVQEMENIVFEGAAAAIARIHLDRAPANGTLSGIQSGNADVLALDLHSLSE
ncbi:MAG: phosphoglycerate dehydrogenase, partial [Candidatus Acidiferrales bacterium]